MTRLFVSVSIATNYVRIDYTSEKRVYEYNVQFVPPLDDTKTRKIAFHKAINHGIQEEKEYKAYVFDGMMLFLPDKPEEDSNNVKKDISFIFSR